MPVISPSPTSVKILVADKWVCEISRGVRGGRMAGRSVLGQDLPSHVH